MIVYVCEELVDRDDEDDNAQWVIRHIYADFNAAKAWGARDMYNREYYAVKVE